MFARLTQLDLEGANTKPDQRRLDSVHCTGLLAHQRLTLAGRTPRIFLSNARNRGHAAVLGLAAEPAENRPHQQSGVQAVRLRSPVFARHWDAGWVDHIDLDSSSPQPAGK